MKHRRSWIALGGVCGLSLCLLAACANGLIADDEDAATGDSSTTNPDTGTTSDTGMTSDAKTDAGCAAGEVKCGPQCSNLQTDPLHCGTCQTQCANGQGCENGECHLTCTQPLSRCTGGDGGVEAGGPESCVDLKKDGLNCGTCGTTCAQSFVCDAGGCDLVCGDAGTRCPGTDGGPTCFDTTSDNSHCGACGTVCTGGKVCVASTCQTVALSNIAPLGTMTSSGGGSSSYGPAKANDGVMQANLCSSFCWTNGGSSLGSDWLQVTWPAAHVVSSINVDTNTTGTDSCGNSGRCLAGAQVQYWNGASWVTATTISGKTNDWSYTFPAPVTTTQLRLYGVYAAGGQASNPIVFEWQVMGQ